jgi:ABC-type transport system involved in multi-copper enzyme maturation permease subunit
MIPCGVPHLPALIHRLSPLGPIFSKELRVTARRKRTYLLRFIYLGLLLLVLLAAFAPQRMPESAVARANRLAELGYNFFIAFAWFTLMAMVLAGPVLTSTAISAERLHNTLGVLLMTPISAWQIVAGKLFSRVLIALTLIGLSLPVLAVVRLMGGVEIAQMLAVLALCVATLLFTASVGLLFSILLRRAYAVILLSYALFFLVWGIIPTLAFWGIALLSSSTGAGPNLGALQWAVKLISQFNPFTAMMQAVFGQSAGGVLALAPWKWSAIWQLVLAMITLIVCARLVRRVAAREGETPAAQRIQILPPQFNQRPDAPEAAGAGALPAATSTSKKHRRRDVSDNPVLWRELGRPLLSRPWQRWLSLILLTGILGVSYILIAVGEQLDEPYVQLPFAWIFCMIMTALTCVLSATAIAQEKESDTWTLLLATAVTPRQIIAGKVLGLLRRLAWPAALIAAHLLLFTLTGAITRPGLVVTLALIFGTNFLWTATGLYFSLRLRTVTFAVVLNLMMPLVAYLGAWLVFVIIGAEWLVEVYSPYAYFDDAIVRNRDDRDDPAMLLALAGSIAYVLLAVLLLIYTARRFDAIVGRAPQTEPLQQAAVHAAPAPATVA